MAFGLAIRKQHCALTPVLVQRVHLGLCHRRVEVSGRGLRELLKYYGSGWKVISQSRTTCNVHVSRDTGENIAEENQKPFFTLSMSEKDWPPLVPDKGTKKDFAIKPHHVLVTVSWHSPVHHSQSPSPQLNRLLFPEVKGIQSSQDARYPTRARCTTLSAGIRSKTPSRYIKLQILPGPNMHFFLHIPTYDKV